MSSAANDLGESPYWDVDARRLYWIDAWRTQVYALDPATGETRASSSGGARRPADRLDRPSRGGGMIAGVKGGFVTSISTAARRA